MDKVTGIAIDASGNVVVGATVTVTNWNTGASVTLYEDDETATIANPTVTDARGMYAFNVPDGTYKVAVSKDGITLSQEKIIVQDMRFGGRLLGKLIGADFNVTTDQEIKIRSGRYIIRRIIVTSASISLTTAAGGIYTSTSKGGTALVAAGQVYSALTAAAKFLDLTLEAIVGTDRRTESSLYLSLTTPQGAAATGDVYVIGDRLTD